VQRLARRRPPFPDTDRKLRMIEPFIVVNGAGAVAPRRGRVDAAPAGGHP
jgi:hypothetical protein